MRASPFCGTASGIKPENSFSALSPLSPTVARCARHSHPSPPKEKAASRKKSRLRRKKTAPTAKKNGASCVSRGHVPTCGGLPQPTEAHRSRFRYLQAALRLRLACMSTICHLRWLACASPLSWLRIQKCAFSVGVEKAHLFKLLYVFNYYFFKMEHLSRGYWGWL